MVSLKRTRYDVVTRTRHFTQDSSGVASKTSAKKRCLWVLKCTKLRPAFTILLFNQQKDVKKSVHGACVCLTRFSLTVLQAPIHEEFPRQKEARVVSLHFIPLLASST